MIDIGYMQVIAKSEISLYTINCVPKLIMIFYPIHVRVKMFNFTLKRYNILRIPKISRVFVLNAIFYYLSLLSIRY